MFHRETRLPGITVLFVGIALLATPNQMLAQHGGGGMSIGAPAGGPVGSRPDGVAEGDGLKNFHRAIAVQATAEQRAAFAKVAQYAQAASEQLQDFRKSLPQAPSPTALSDRATTLDQAIAQARASSQNFLSSFSSAQKSGLQDIARKLEKADSELDKELKTLDQIVHTQKPEIQPVASSAATLEKALASFQSEQLALGREMSILFPAPGQGVTFSLPPVTNSIDIAGQSISIPESGAVISPSSPSSNESGHNLYTLKLVADLSDLQQNVTAILRSQLNRSPRCGERIAIQQATLTPLAPASLVVANLHFERWVCSPPGQGSPMEVADGEATLEVKLTPSIEPAAGLRLVPEITRVEAQGMLRNMLRSGDLGVTLREQIADSLLAALQKATDLKTALPPAAQQATTLQKALFQDDGADQLSLVLDGQLQFSDEQAQQFAAQLKQRLAAQGTTPP